MKYPLRISCLLGAIIIMTSCSHTNATLLPFVEDTFSDGSLQFVVDRGTQREADDFAKQLGDINASDITEFTLSDGTTDKQLTVDQIASLVKSVSELKVSALEQKDIESLKLQKIDAYIVELRCGTEHLGLAFTGDCLIYDMVEKKTYTCSENFVKDMVDLYKSAV